MATARAIAKRSLCSRDQVGAVIVTAKNRIIDTGYNGPPQRHDPSRNGDSCVNWCERGKKRTTFRMDGIGVDLLTGMTLAGDYSDCDSLHAEANALLFGDRAQREHGTIYVSSGVCGACAKLIANSGLRRVVYCDTQREDGAPHRDTDRWTAFMQHCGLEVVRYESTGR